MKKKEIYYFSPDEKDEFVTPPKKIKRINGDYVYMHNNLLVRLLSFIAYWMIAMPIAFIYARLIRRVHFVNRSALKAYRRTGFFVYANHTHSLSDAFTPCLLLSPKRNYTIVNAANVSLPVLGKATKLLGALPLPDDMSSSKNFLKAIETVIVRGYSILIYPEAHIWPFYTKIRNFDDKSFVYPARFETPVFAITTTYQKKKHGYKTIIYADGPFEAPPYLDRKAKQTYLYDSEISVTRKRVNLSNFEKHKYVLKEKS